MDKKLLFRAQQRILADLDNQDDTAYTRRLRDEFQDLDFVEIWLDNDDGSFVIGDHIAEYDYYEDGVFYYHMYIDHTWVPISGRTSEELIEQMLDEIDNSEISKRCFGRRDNELIMIDSSDNESVCIYQVLEDDNDVVYSVCKIPVESTTIYRHGSTLSLTARPKSLQTSFYEGPMDEMARVIIQEFRQIDDDDLYDIDLQVITPDYRGDPINHTCPL